MKNIIAYICFALLYLSVQAQKGYVKFRTSATIQGSTRGIVKGMEDAGYGPKGIESWFGTIDYPRKIKYPSLYIEGGIHIAERKSLSVLLGLENMGYVDGYSSHTGADVKIKHVGYVISPKLNFHQRAALVGIGPTFMVFHCRDYVDFSEINKATKLFPGVSITAETLFRGKRQFSIGVFSTLNLYAGSTIQIIAPNASTGAGYMSKISPTNIQAGLLLRIAHR